MAKVYDTATDLITFARSSSGTALRRVGYGDEIFGDPSFDGTGDWSLPADSVTVSGGKLTYDAVANIRGAEQNVNIYAGRVYQISFEVLSGTAYLYLSTGNISTSLISGLGPSGYGVGVHQINVVANGNYSTIGFTLSKFFGGTACELAYFSMKEVIFDRATDDLVLFDHPDDIPRIEYAADGSLKGLLIEEARSNLVALSEDFENAAWGKAGTTAIDSTLVIGPDGTLSGRRVLNFDDAVGDRLIEQVSITNATLTGSMWVKGEGDNIGKDILLTVKRNGGTFAGTDVSHTLTADWKRINATFTQLPDNTGAQIVLNNPANGNEASEVLVYGAQLEQGSFATSYIPTAGGQKTRDPDLASIPVTAFGYNQDAGTVVVELGHFNIDTSLAGIVSITSDPPPLSEWTPLIYASTSAIVFSVQDAGLGQVSTQVSGDRRTTGGIVGFAMKENSFAASVGGSTPQTDSSGTMSTNMSVMRIGTFASNPAFLNGHIKSLSYFPRRLTDAQLQELTA